MTATTGVGGLIYGRALVDQRTGKKTNFDELGKQGPQGPKGDTSPPGGHVWLLHRGNNGLCSL